MIYAMTIICGLSGAPCIAMQDNRGPYESRAGCKARHDELRPYVRDVLVARFTGRIGQPARVVELCDTLERIRRALPGAYGGAGQEVPV